MATNERGHEVPAATGVAPSRAQIFDAFANSINDVILCDDATDRDAKITGLPYTPDATRPAFFWRADATPGMQFEAWDGTTLYVYDARDTGWQDCTPSTAYDNGSSLKVRLKSGRVELEGDAIPDDGTVSTSDLIETLDPPFRPARPRRYLIPGAAGIVVRVQVNTDGAITVLSVSGATSAAYFSISWLVS